MSALAPATRRAESLPPPAYRRHAGHAAHFLQRLDRVDPRQSELALALYNDPGLLKATLARAKLPEGAERVAIALAHAEGGPHLVVTREGRFVTCLGAGMRVRHPVITRAQLDAAARQVDRARELIATAEHVSANMGRAKALIAKLYEQHEWVSREDIEAVLRWEPLLGYLFLEQLAVCGDHLLRYSARARNVLRPRRRDEELLRWYHGSVHALAHLYVLAGASEVSRTFIDHILEAGFPAGCTLTGLGTAMDVGYLSARAAWAVARWPAFLGHQKEMLRGADHPLDLADGYFGVAAIGLGKRALRAEAQRAVCAERELDPRLAEPAAVLRSHLSMVFTHHDTLVEWGMARGRVGLAERLGVRAEEVSDVDARAQLASAPGHAVRTPDDVAASAIALPALVRAAPEELYLPRRVIEQVRVPWTMERAIALLEGHRQAYGVQRPVRAPRVGGRNDPCPCGSGKKLKRCCVLSAGA